MSQLKALRSAATLEDVAALLGFKLSALSYLLYKKENSSKYKIFEIPKRSGGFRKICSPSDDLKLLQRRLADVLQNCLDEINKSFNRGDSSDKPDRISHGFRRHRSIITNARQHRNKRFVFNVGLEDFFGNINFGRVRGFFMANKSFQLSPKVATIIAQIACFENSLPQGSPCSPVISNLIGHILDIHLVRLASRLGCTYTRYADDITFSTNKPNFPSELAGRVETSPHCWEPGKELSLLVKKCGFSLNAKKTRMQYRDTRQEVTGLVVNSKINVKREYRHDVRAMVHRLFTTGSFQYEEMRIENGVCITESVPGTLDQLRGMLGFIDSIDIFNKKINSTSDARRLTSKELMYRRFLLYKEFYNSSCPVLICEGKTDNVYITHAIRQKASDYPFLAEVKKDGAIAIKLRRFKYTDNSTGRILGIGGGSSDLKHFIKSYHDDTERFKAAGMKHPVILLIDNDSGAGPVLSLVKQLTGKSFDKKKPSLHLFKNLYLVATPLVARKDESMIEDFFDSATKSMTLGGKTFDASNKFDFTKSYGKSDFAYKVVKPNAEKIDFSLFGPLLTLISGVVEAHAKQHPV